MDAFVRDGTLLPGPGGPRTQPSPTLRLGFGPVAPWLHLAGGVWTLVLVGYYLATRSRLATDITPGESAVFAAMRLYIPGVIWAGLAGLGALAALQWCPVRRERSASARLIRLLVGVELLALGLLALGLGRGMPGLTAWAHVALQGALASQVFIAIALRGDSSEDLALPALAEGHPGLFLGFLFVFAAVPAGIDPGLGRLRAHVAFDSGAELALSHVLPPLLSGAVGLWFGAAALSVLAVSRAAWIRLQAWPRSRQLVALAPFLGLPAVYAAVSARALVSAIAWELNALDLDGLVLPMWILATGSAGTLSAVAFQRLRSVPAVRQCTSPTGLAALVATAGMLLPVTRWITRRGREARAWWLLLAAGLVGHAAVAWWVLFGPLFNPWFTAYSHLKGVLLQALALGTAGMLVLVLTSRPRTRHRDRPSPGRLGLVAATALVVGLLPFAVLDRSPETKAAILQYHELAMVDAAYARQLVDLLGLGRWVRLGQTPAATPGPPPWPPPWVLTRTGASLLPRDFNLLVIVVDALRGDAFHSAGHPRNLTPFLDRWARDEAVSFRRAYSQGGGTFAAFPFLVAGRSRLTLYGSGLHRENLYLKLAEAEGIRHLLVVGDFGPRAIFPPDATVIELRGASPAPGRSVPADEVFRWAREAIGTLPPGSRFLAFLQLMDVHNDLWKKADGENFGDAPRDLYDNNVSYVDRAVARFVTWLREQGLYDRTVILFTSDHGEQFWEHGTSLHGHTLYEEDLRIPLIFLAHGVRGRIEDVPVVAADLAPTLVELAGYSVDPPYDDPHMGISLVPLLLHGERGRYLCRDVVGRASFKRSVFLYRNWRWKLIYSADLDLLWLFDLATDPGERRNLLREHPALAAELERDLMRYLATVEGRAYRPVLSGAVDDRGS